MNLSKDFVSKLEAVTGVKIKTLDDFEKAVEVRLDEFKKAGSKVYILKTKITEDFLPDFEDLKENYELIFKLINDGKAISVASVRQFGLPDTISKMCFGNKIGFEFKEEKCLFKPRFASFVIEAAEELNIDKLEYLGNTISEKEIIISENEKLDLEELIKIWQEPLEKVFPTKKEAKSTKIEIVEAQLKENSVLMSQVPDNPVIIEDAEDLPFEEDKPQKKFDW